MSVGRNVLTVFITGISLLMANGYKNNSHRSLKFPSFDPIFREHWIMNFPTRGLECPEALKTGRGYGETVEGDKCNRVWSEIECQNEPTLAEFHWGQFGHKVLFLFCDDCYARTLALRAAAEAKGWFMSIGWRERGIEIIKER